MSTISVPVSAELENIVDSLILSGLGSNRADVFRRAVQYLAEEQAIWAVLLAQKEPALKGDLRDLMKKFK